MAISIYVLMLGLHSELYEFINGPAAVKLQVVEERRET